MGRVTSDDLEKVGKKMPPGPFKGSRPNQCLKNPARKRPGARVRGLRGPAPARTRRIFRIWPPRPQEILHSAPAPARTREEFLRPPRGLRGLRALIFLLNLSTEKGKRRFLKRPGLGETDPKGQGSAVFLKRPGLGETGPKGQGGAVF